MLDALTAVVIMVPAVMIVPVIVLVVLRASLGRSRGGVNVPVLDTLDLGPALLGRLPEVIGDLHPQPRLGGGAERGS